MVKILFQSFLHGAIFITPTGDHSTENDTQDSFFIQHCCSETRARDAMSSAKSLEKASAEEALGM